MVRVDSLPRVTTRRLSSENAGVMRLKSPLAIGGLSLVAFFLQINPNLEPQGVEIYPQEMNLSLTLFLLV